MQPALKNPLYPTFYKLTSNGNPVLANAPLRCSEPGGPLRVKLKSNFFRDRTAREMHTQWAYEKARGEVCKAAVYLFGDAALQDRRVTQIIHRHFVPGSNPKKTVVTAAIFWQVAQAFDGLRPQTPRDEPLWMIRRRIESSREAPQGAC